MISEIQIENFKSISKLTLEPGTVTVLIGENGSGKSNILEAIGFLGAASAEKLNDEFLYSRGIRVTENEFMCSLFTNELSINFNYHSPSLNGMCKLNILNNTIKNSAWIVNYDIPTSESELAAERNTQEYKTIEDRILKSIPNEIPKESHVNIKETIFSLLPEQLIYKRKIDKIKESEESIFFQNFLIYAPENSALRNFQTEGAIKPLGVKGEGLLKHLLDLSLSDNGDFAKELKSHLALLGWFGDLHLPTQLDEIRGSLRIQDRWLTQNGRIFDQRSANEGFLYLLFYFTLFLSKQTPKFFAIDNLDNALNPKLCAELMRQLVVLAEKNGKQAVITTHNPAILDGLNLHDDKQRLYVVRRNSEGHTIVDRVNAPRPRPDGQSIRLSQAFMSGMLGGLPEHF